MKHRFFLDADLATGATYPLASEESHHARVVRVGEGEVVEVFNGRGASFFATFNGGAVLVGEAAPDRESSTALHLAMAIINLEKFELVIQKSTELGVRSITPLVTDRTEIRAERYRGKGERWQKIAFEAVKQSGRSRTPMVEPPARFADVITREGTNILFDAETGSATWQTGDAATLFIGPEGGWSDDELRLARERGAVFAGLGARRLRAETAGIVAVAIAAARCGDI
jgi:16S rRNA (uracil1498-N3)-methyltransferase